MEANEGQLFIKLLPINQILQCKCQKPKYNSSYVISIDLIVNIIQIC